MSYEAALQAAGAKILRFEQFGSYQGDWWAKVEFNGKTGWVHGYYGSCSGCDAFEGEFGYMPGEHVGDRYVYPEDPEHPGHADYMVRLKRFGAGYLDDLLDQAAAEAEAGRYADWDLDAGSAVQFVKDHAISGEPSP